MDIRKLQRVIVDALDDVKAHDIRVFNTTEQTGMFDRVIVATGTSNRQTRALASHVRDKAKAAGGHVISTEGEDTGEWVLVDLGDAVVHIMQPAIRVYYNLEELWGGKPVRIKLNGNGLRGRAPADPEARKARPRTRAKAPDEAATQGSASQAPVHADAATPRRRRIAEPHEDAASQAPVAAAKTPRRSRVKPPVESIAGAAKPARTGPERVDIVDEPVSAATEPTAERETATSPARRRVARKVQVS